MRVTGAYGCHFSFFPDDRATGDVIGLVVGAVVALPAIGAMARAASTGSEVASGLVWRGLWQDQ